MLRRAERMILNFAFISFLPTLPPWGTHCAWKSISTGSWLLMTLSVKSSWSWTLKETSRREVCGRERGRVRDGERKETRVVADCREVEKEEEEVVVVVAAVDARRQQISFAESDQILRTSSLWAICAKDKRAEEECGLIEFIVISAQFDAGSGKGRRGCTKLRLCHKRGRLRKASMLTAILYMQGGAWVGVFSYMIYVCLAEAQTRFDLILPLMCCHGSRHCVTLEAYLSKPATGFIWSEIKRSLNPFYVLELDRISLLIDCQSTEH